MESVYYKFPPYTLQIAEQVKSMDWFIHSFQLSNVEDVYNPAGYLYNAEFFKKEYTVYLDLNIYQYVISAFKKTKIKELHRNAIALIVFGHFTNIIFDPTLAIYEKLNYLKHCPDEVTEDLELFRKIDNADMDKLAEFALGVNDNLILPEGKYVNHDVTKAQLTRYSRLKKWDSLYLMTLVIVKLYHFEVGNSEDKLKIFLTWCFEEFGYSLVAISLLISLVGNSPIPKLMKYKPEASLNDKKQSLYNMTWDLFLLDKFFEGWVKKPKEKEFIYASNDKPLKKVLELAISIQLQGTCNHLISLIPEAVISELNNIPYKMNTQTGRTMFSTNNFQQYRNDLIKTHESLLLA